MSPQLKKRILLIFGSIWLTSFVLLLGYYFIMIAPCSAKLSDLNKQIEAITGNAFSESNKKCAQENLKQGQQLHGKVARFVIDREKWIDMMPYLSDIAEAIEVSMFASKDVSGEKVEEVAECQKIGFKVIDVSFNSNFFKFARFINKLEEGDPIIFLRDFTIERSPDDTNLNSVKMELQIFVGKDRKDISELFAKLYETDKSSIGSIN